MIRLVFFFGLVTMCSCSSISSPELESPDKIHVGRFESRGLWWKNSLTKNKIAVLMIPGSGAQGPEEAIPASMTAHSLDSKTFEIIAQPFIENSISVLALGKPGVDFFSGAFDKTKWFYNKDLYLQLEWKDLIENVSAAIIFLKSQGATTIFLLGHSEGTQVAVDFAREFPDQAQGLILLGYSAEDVKTILEYQLFRRPIEMIVEKEFKMKSGSMLSKEQYLRGPKLEEELPLTWSNSNSLSYAEICEQIRKNKNLNEIFESMKSNKIYGNGIFSRGSRYEATVSFPGDIYIFTGELDVQTLPREALKVQELCLEQKKQNCFVKILPGVGHNFSAPKAPRANPLLDMTLGPPSPILIDELKKIAKNIARK